MTVEDSTLGIVYAIGILVLIGVSGACLFMVFIAENWLDYLKVASLWLAVNFIIEWLMRLLI